MKIISIMKIVMFKSYLYVKVLLKNFPTTSVSNVWEISIEVHFLGFTHVLDFSNGLLPFRGESMPMWCVDTQSPQRNPENFF